MGSSPSTTTEVLKLREIPSVSNRLIRPKKRASNPWRDVIAGCAIIVAAIVYFFVAEHTGIFKVIEVLFFVAGVRWIIVGLVHRRDLTRR